MKNKEWLKMKKKIIISISTIIILIGGFMTYKYIEFENLKNNIAGIKTEIKTKIITSDNLKFLQANKLISKDQVQVIDNANGQVKKSINTKTYLSDLKTVNDKLSTLDQQLVSTLTKKVNDTKTSQDKALKSLKVKTKTEKTNQAKYLKIITDLKAGTKLNDLVKNINTLTNNQKAITSLNKTITTRVAKEQAEQQALLNANSGNTNTYYKTGGTSTNTKVVSAKTNYTEDYTNPFGLKNEGDSTIVPINSRMDTTDRIHYYCTYGQCPKGAIYK
jgi:hypothetical protein